MWKHVVKGHGIIGTFCVSFKTASSVNFLKTHTRRILRLLKTHSHFGVIFSALWLIDQYLGIGGTVVP